MMDWVDNESTDEREAIVVRDGPFTVCDPLAHIVACLIQQFRIMGEDDKTIADTLLIASETLRPEDRVSN